MARAPRVNRSHSRPTRRDNDGLRALRRRFTQRWVTGVAIGGVMVFVNWVGYATVSRRAMDHEDITTETLVDLQRLRDGNLVLTVISLTVLVVLAFAFFRPLDRTLRRETREIARLEADQARETLARRFDGEVHEALEMATDEAAVHRFVGHVFERIAPDRPAELLLADSSESHLMIRAEHPTAGRAGCGVTSPFDCPAVRRARALTFPSATAINACPQLRDRTGDPRSAHCVPIAFMGRSLGVLHSTGAEGEPVDELTASRMSTVAGQVGNRIGTVRAFDTAQLQASTDSLTGLPNRRAVEDELTRRLANGEEFAVAIGDLDNFKLRNDTYGHDAGDRGLRLFADAVRRALRTEDLFARWGGEEFVIALPGMDREGGVAVLDRVRLALVDACARSETPPITASFGLVDTSVERTLEALLRAADEGLAVAKRSGKDQVRLGPAMAAPAGSSSVGKRLDVTSFEEAAQPSNTTVLRP